MKDSYIGVIGVILSISGYFLLISNEQNSESFSLNLGYIFSIIILLHIVVLLLVIKKSYYALLLITSFYFIFLLLLFLTYLNTIDSKILLGLEYSDCNIEIEILGWIVLSLTAASFLIFSAILNKKRSENRIGRLFFRMILSVFGGYFLLFLLVVITEVNVIEINMGLPLQYIFVGIGVYTTWNILIKYETKFLKKNIMQFIIILLILLFLALLLNPNKIKWITPKNSVCFNNGGKIQNAGCIANWSNAQKICSESGGKLPSIIALKRIIRKCRGSNYEGIIEKDNTMNSFYQSCYKNQGFISESYWSSQEVLFPTDINFYTGLPAVSSNNSNHYVRCIQEKGKL